MERNTWGKAGEERSWGSWLPLRRPSRHRGRRGSRGLGAAPWGSAHLRPGLKPRARVRVEVGLGVGWVFRVEGGVVGVWEQWLFHQLSIIHPSIASKRYYDRWIEVCCCGRCGHSCRGDGCRDRGRLQRGDVSPRSSRTPSSPSPRCLGMPLLVRRDVEYNACICICICICICTPLLIRRDVEYDAWDLTSGAGGVCPKPHFVPPLPLECTLCVAWELANGRKRIDRFLPDLWQSLWGKLPNCLVGPPQPRQAVIWAKICKMQLFFKFLAAVLYYLRQQEKYMRAT